MLGRTGHANPIAFFRNGLKRLASRRAGVALIIALSTPLLIAITGLSVDVGFWFQNQTSLQSAADAAALAAAMSDSRLNNSTAPTKASGTAVIAQTAANQATNSAFHFSSNSATSNANPQVSVTCCSGVGTTTGVYNSNTAYTATVSAPRQSFLSQVAGLGLAGMPSGTQYASATASMTSSTAVSGQSCLFVNPKVSTTSGVTFVTDNGGGSSGGISAAGCSITVNCGSGDTAFNPPNSSSADITAQNILVANSSGCTVGDSSHLFTSAYTQSSCASSGGSCGVQTSTAAATDPLASMGDAIGDSVNSSGTFITPVWSTACTNAGFNNTTAVNLRTALGSSYSLSGTTYAISGICEPSSTTADFSAGGTYFFPNGLSVSSDITFGPGIYYFGGSGLSASGGLTVTSNGATLVFVGTATLTMHGNGNGGNGEKVALVAPDTSLSDSCLLPSEYNNSLTPATDAVTLDGTAGGGICGVAIYQGRNDSAAMTLAGNTGSTVIGIVYAPDAQLTLSGNGGFSSTTYTSGTLSGQTGTFSLMVNNVVLNGNGNLNLHMNTNDNAGSVVNQHTSTTSTTAPLLVN